MTDKPDSSPAQLWTMTVEALDLEGVKLGKPPVEELREDGKEQTRRIAEVSFEDLFSKEDK